MRAATLSLFVSLFLSVASAATEAPPREPAAPGTAALEGRCLERIRDGRVEPLRSANVFVAGAKRGSMSDERGCFHIPGLPAGQWRVKVMRAGLRPLDTLLTFTDHQVTRLDAELVSQPLGAFGRADLPGRALRGRWRRAPVIRAYRLEHVLDARVDSSNAIGGARIAAALERDAAWSSRLRAAFADSRSWSRVGPAEVNMGELYGLRFHDAKGWIDVVVATRSAVVSVSENGGRTRSYSWNAHPAALRRLFD